MSYNPIIIAPNPVQITLQDSPLSKNSEINTIQAQISVVQKHALIFPQLFVKNHLLFKVYKVREPKSWKGLNIKLHIFISIKMM